MGLLLYAGISKAWSLRGHQVELLDGRDARCIEPALSTRILGCLYYPHGGNTNPVKTVLALAFLAQRHGASILTHHELTSITHLDDSTYQVVTAIPILSEADPAQQVSMWPT